MNEYDKLSSVTSRLKHQQQQLDELDNAFNYKFGDVTSKNVVESGKPIESVSVIIKHNDTKVVLNDCPSDVIKEIAKLLEKRIADTKNEVTRAYNECIGGYY